MKTVPTISSKKLAWPVGSAPTTRAFVGMLLLGIIVSVAHVWTDGKYPHSLLGHALNGPFGGVAGGLYPSGRRRFSGYGGAFLFGWNLAMLGVAAFTRKRVAWTALLVVTLLWVALAA